MLTKYDEFLCHQIVSTFDHPATSAREWTERLIFHTHDTSGKVHLSNGFGLYPNRNIIDAFGCLTLNAETQYNVRASRELRPQPDEVVVGPFSYEVVEPLKKVRYCLEENEYGLTYDVEFEGIAPCYEEDPQFFRSRGRVEENVQRYDQVGRAAGWIKVNGRTYQLDKSSFFVERDHSWGIRRESGIPETGVQPGEIPEGYFFSWGVMQFPMWGAAYHIREAWDGTRLLTTGGVFYPYETSKEQVKMTSMEHDFQFRPDIRKITSGRLTFGMPDGAEIEITLRPQNYCCLKAAGYFGYNGFVHGQWMGPSWSDGYKLDLTDPAVLSDVSFFDNTSCELRCGDETGYGVFEVVNIGKYPRYGYEGY